MSDIQSITNSPEFWLALGFLLFVYFSYKLIRNSISQIISDYIDNLAKHINQAASILSESNMILAETQNKLSGLANYEKTVVKQTHDLLAQLKEDKEKELAKIISDEERSSTNTIESLFHKYNQNIMQEIYTKTKANIISKFSDKTSGSNVLSDMQIKDCFLDKTISH